ncbi:MAG: HAD family hydrolase [Inquilinaceae bacterium]
MSASVTARTDKPVRIALWSGPRTISTALMRAWENRPDTAVIDEPFYAHYLVRTGLDHPMRDAVIASQDPDWRNVAALLTGPVPGGRAVFYQKHMAHHLLAEMEGPWLDRLSHGFLIRDPRALLASYAAKRDEATLADTGLPQQVDLFHRVRAATGRTPPVIDSADVLRDPAQSLHLLCAAFGVPFDTAMLSWPAGRRPTDGVWGAHWYGTVERSTRFEPPAKATRPLPEEMEPLAEQALPYYRELYGHRLGR